MHPIKVYRDTKLDYTATYLPLLKHRIALLGLAFNDKFVELSQK